MNIYLKRGYDGRCDIGGLEIISHDNFFECTFYKPNLCKFNIYIEYSLFGESQYYIKIVEQDIRSVDIHEVIKTYLRDIKITMITEDE